MKRIVLLYAFIFATFSLISCSSDDDTPSSQNQLLFDDVLYDIPNAAASQIALPDNPKKFQLALMSSELSYDILENGGDVTGSTIVFQFDSTIENEITEGVYDILEDDAIMVINTNFSDEAILRSKTQYASSGILSIEKNNTTYTIDYKVTFKNGKTAIGQYHGSISIQ